MEHESSLTGGFRFDEYEVIRVLGAGGFGITYLGYDHHLDKPVAIKEYLPNDLAVRKGDTTVVAKSSGDQSDFDWGLERFLEEARVLARFDHPNLPKVYRYFQAHGTGYIVMEYVEGQTLSEMLKAKGKLKEQALKQIMLPLLEGLEKVHQAGYLHRDIKPANIVIRDDGSPVLIDFGAARAALGVKSRSVTSIVTPGYAPIEQYSSKAEQGVGTDLYAMAAVMYKAITGKTPEDATDRMRDDPLKQVTEAGKGQASQSFLEAIDWGLAVEESQRPQSIDVWRRALQGDAPAAVKDKPSETKAASVPAFGPAASSRTLLGLSATVVLVVLIGGGVWLLQAPSNESGMDVAATRDGDDADEPASSDEASHSEEALAASETTDSTRESFEPEMVQVDDFSIGKHEVTQGQWKAIMGDNPSHFQKGDNYPVESVSWQDVQKYIEKLNARTDKTYRLPTENEWARACHGGGPEKEYCGGDDVDAVAWYDANSKGSTHPVGRKEPNRLGIYDMSGNVAEWTSSVTEDARALRGGSWLNSPSLVSSASKTRAKATSGLGFHFLGLRLVHD